MIFPCLLHSGNCKKIIRTKGIEGRQIIAAAAQNRIPFTPTSVYVESTLIDYRVV